MVAGNAEFRGPSVGVSGDHLYETLLLQRVPHRHWRWWVFVGGSARGQQLRPRANAESGAGGSRGSDLSHVPPWKLSSPWPEGDCCLIGCCNVVVISSSSVVLDQRAQELEAGVDEDVPRYLLLQLRDRVHHVALRTVELFQSGF
jgi:hypothetical protein